MKLKPKATGTVFLSVLVLSVIAFVMPSTSPTTAHAIFGGESAVGSHLVVSLVNPRDASRPGCSGALLLPQVVVSAAHCLGNAGKTYVDPVVYPESIFVTYPGISVGTDNVESRVQVLMAVVVPGYTQTFNPASGDFRGQYDDIAFYFLERSFGIDAVAEVASLGEVEALRTEGRGLSLFGYGLQRWGEQDGSPYRVSLKPFPDMSHFVHTALPPERHIGAVETGAKAICGGDSGGPWYGEFRGVTKIVAVTAAGSGCQAKDVPGNGGTIGALIGPHLPLLFEYLPVFDSQLPLLVDRIKQLPAQIEAERQTRIDAAKQAGTYIQNWEGCGQPVDGYLQIRRLGGDWIDWVKVEGWVRVSECAGGEQKYRPWASVELPSDVEVRWRLFSSSWEVFSSVRSSSVLRAAQLQLAESQRPPADPMSGTPATKSGSKKRTIVCIRGKVLRQVTGVTPKCPKGFKIRSSPRQ